MRRHLFRERLNYHLSKPENLDLRNRLLNKEEHLMSTKFTPEERAMLEGTPLGRAILEADSRDMSPTSSTQAGGEHFVTIGFDLADATVVANELDAIIKRLPKLFTQVKYNK